MSSSNVSKTSTTVDAPLTADAKYMSRMTTGDRAETVVATLAFSLCSWLFACI